MIRRIFVNNRSELLFFICSISAVIVSVVFGGFTLNSSMSVLTILIVMFSVILLSKYDSEVRFNHISLFVMLFTIDVIISSFVSFAPMNSLFGVIRFSLIFLIFFAYELCHNKEDVWKAFSITMFFLGVMLALYSVVQVIKLGYPVASYSHRAFFVQKNSFGAFLNLVIFLSLPIFFNNKNSRYDLFIKSCFFILFLALCFTNSYGVALGFIVGMSVTLFYLRKIILKKDLVWLLSLIVVAFIIDRLFLMSGHAISQLDMHLDSRLPLWIAVYHMIQHVIPWYGSGIYTFVIMYRPFSMVNDVSSGQYAHNDFLQFFTELGYPGLIIFVLLFIFIGLLFLLWLRKKDLDASKKIGGVCLFSGIMSLYAHSMFTYNFYIMPTFVLFSIMLARLNSLYMDSKLSFYLFKFNRVFSKKGFKLIISVIVMSILFWFVVIFTSTRFSEKAQVDINHGKYKGAYKMLRYAYYTHDCLYTNEDIIRYYILLLSHNKNRTNKKLIEDFTKSANPYIKNIMKYGKYNYNSYYTIGNFYRIQGKYKESSMYYKKALSLYPKNRLLLDVYVRSLFLSGNN